MECSNYRIIKFTTLKKVSMTSLLQVRHDKINLLRVTGNMKVNLLINMNKIMFRKFAFYSLRSVCVLTVPEPACKGT